MQRSMPSRLPKRIGAFLIPFLLGLVAVSSDVGAVGEKPRVSVTSPKLGARTAGAVAVSGTASDPDGIRRVVVAAKNQRTKQYWNGSRWVGAYATFDARLGSANARSTSFSGTIPSISDAIWLSVRAVDGSGSYGDVYGGQLNAPTGGVNASGSTSAGSSNEGTIVRDRAKPEVTLTRPGTSFNGGSLTVGGTAADADGVRQVLAQVKDLTTKKYWNGSAWVTSPTWVPTSLSNPKGTNTEFSLRLTAPANPLYISVRAQDDGGTYGTARAVQTRPGASAPASSPSTPAPTPAPSTGTRPAPGASGRPALCAGPVKMGVAIDLYSHVPGGQAFSQTYDSIANNDFCHVSSENSFKRAYLENSRGQQNLAIAQNFVDTAERHGSTSRGHALVWNYRDPAYLGRLNTTELKQNVDDFIAQMMTTYRSVDDWDVVNEPLNWDGYSWWGGVYDKLEGPDGYPSINKDTRQISEIPQYIAQSFRTAGAVRSANGINTDLWINESNVLDPASRKYGGKVDVFYDLAKKMKQQRIPLDGVGFQGHLRVSGPNPIAIWGSTYEVPELTRETAPRICANLKRFRDLGLKVAITEFDVAVPNNASAAQLQEQVDAYKLMYQIAAEIGITDLTIWGTDDARSFYNKPFTYEDKVGTVVPGWGGATLYDKSMQKKRVYTELANFAKNYNSNRPARICN